MRLPAASSRTNNFLFNPIDLETILIQLQDQVPLTMGELWALPIFLRYSCIETLAHELERVIHPQVPASPARFSAAAARDPPTIDQSDPNCNR